MSHFNHGRGGGGGRGTPHQQDPQLPDLRLPALPGRVLDLALIVTGRMSCIQDLVTWCISNKLINKNLRGGCTKAARSKRPNTPGSNPISLLNGKGNITEMAKGPTQNQ